MTGTDYILAYVLIGLAYLLVNVLIRRIDTYDDWMLPLVWWFFWPIFFFALVIVGVGKLIKKN